LHILSWVEYFQQHYDEALRINRQIGNRTWEAFNLRTLGWVHLARGEANEARRACEAGLRLQKELGNKSELASVLECLAELACFQERWRDAVLLWGSAAAFREAIGRRISMVDQERHARKTAEARMAFLIHHRVYGHLESGVCDDD
jgi:tetratricopeptide (TPR) repeat protein